MQRIWHMTVLQRLDLCYTTDLASDSSTMDTSLIVLQRTGLCYTTGLASNCSTTDKSLTVLQRIGLCVLCDGEVTFLQRIGH